MATEYDGSGIETLDQIKEAWKATSAEVNELFGGVSDEQFTASCSDRWTYAKNLEHLTTSAMAFVKGLGMPKMALRLAIGKGDGTSRSLMEVQRFYKKTLAEGGQAGGKFVPAGQASKADALEEWNKCDQLLQKNLASWKESQLDTHRMPHPLIGKLTVREMLFFTIFHTHHHLNNLKSD